MSELSEDQMLAALGVDTAPEPVRKYTKQEERLIAGFEDIQRFVDAQGHAPRHGEDLDIFERLYAVRLDRLRQLPEACELLGPMDRQGLLAGAGEASAVDDLPEDELLAALDTGNPADDDISVLRHVRSNAERRATEEVADRQPCKDFARFQPLFEKVQAELDGGTRKSMRFRRDARIEPGQFFILDGQLALVAEAGEEFDSPQGKKDTRLRVVYANGTESNLLRLSLVRALYKDETGRRVSASDGDAGPLFADYQEEGDTESGTIYVLRSLSDHTYVAEHRELVHKIGVTGGEVEKRIANARREATYLLADVEVVATWKLSNIHRVKLESLLHRIFAPARLDLTIEDRFGEPVRPREWFLVPLAAIDDAVQRIRDGSIGGYVYDAGEARLVASNS